MLVMIAIGGWIVSDNKDNIYYRHIDTGRHGVFGIFDIGVH